MNVKKLLSGLWLTEQGLFKFFSFVICIIPWATALILKSGDQMLSLALVLTTQVTLYLIRGNFVTQKSGISFFLYFSHFSLKAHEVITMKCCSKSGTFDFCSPQRHKL